MLAHLLVHPTRAWTVNIELNSVDGYRTEVSPRNQKVAFTESQQYVINPTNPGGALDDRIKHRLHIRRGAADDAEHLGGCGLMLQGFAQFRVSVTGYLEHSAIFISGSRLVVEGL